MLFSNSLHRMRGLHNHHDDFPFANLAGYPVEIWDMRSLLERWRGTNKRGLHSSRINTDKQSFVRGRRWQSELDLLSLKAAAAAVHLVARRGGSLDGP
jgi:hypothetical protein